MAGKWKYVHKTNRCDVIDVTMKKRKDELSRKDFGYRAAPQQNKLENSYQAQPTIE